MYLTQSQFFALICGLISDSYVFRPPGSASGLVSYKYRMDPKPPSSHVSVGWTEIMVAK
jgi:hypothetical protein